MKAGKEYELLIEQLYRDLEPNAIITHDDHIYDERAKIKRQIDVSIRYKLAGVELLIIVQAKDYKIKANVEVVDQFQQVIEDTRANKGILICTKGFSEAALNKAKSYGIECLSIHSALNKKWETLVKVEVERVVHNFHIQSELILNVEHKAGKEFKFDADMYSYDGINLISLMNIIKDQIIDKNSWNDIRKKKIKLLFKDINLYHVFDENEMLPVEGFVEIEYKNSKVTRFFLEPYNYIYEHNHLSKESKLHNLEITIDDLSSLGIKEFVNDPSVSGKPDIKATIFVFKDVGRFMIFQQQCPGALLGEVSIKGNQIALVDEYEKRQIELEGFFKNEKP